MIALTSTISSLSEMDKIDQVISDIAQNGGHAALEQLYLSIRDAVYGYALSILKNTHDAEDVFHDCFISVYQAAQSYVPKGKGKIAENILEQAAIHEVPVYEDPNLVQLLGQLDLNESIPEELYQAVAEVFSFIYRLDQQQGAFNPRQSITKKIIEVVIQSNN